MNFTSIVSHSATIAQNIYNQLDKEDYGKVVVESISRTERYAGSLYQELNQIYERSKLDESLPDSPYHQFWSDLGNPIENINIHYQAYVQGTSTSDIEQIADEINKHLMNIHLAVCGKAEKNIEALELYMSVVNNDIKETSRIEQAYCYFSGILLTSMLKGFALLGACKHQKFGQWKTLFLEGDTLASESCLQSPILAYQGKQCQQLIDTYSEDDAWAGRSNLLQYINETTIFHLDGQLNVPEGCVLSGMDFFLDRERALAPFGWFGIPGTLGFVENPRPVVAVSGRSVPAVDDEVGCFKIDTSEIRIPKDCAVVDFKWSRKQGVFRNADGEHDFYLYYLLLKYAPMQVEENGKVIVGEARWTTHELDISDPNKELPDTVLNGEDPMEWLYWTRWINDFNLSAPEQWKVPINAVQIADKKLTFRVNLHEKLFGAV